jgi:O-antigen ligase
MNTIIPFKKPDTAIQDSRLSYYLVMVFIALALGIFIAFGIFTFTQTLMLGIIAFLLFVIFNRPDMICYALVIFMFTPLSLGIIMRLRIVWVAEPIILILFLLVFLKNMTAKEKAGVFSIKANPFFIPLVIYVGVLAFNYARFPLPASSVAGIAEEMGGIRYYYDKLLMFSMFFSIAYLAETDYAFTRRLSKVMFVMVLVITSIGMLTTFIDPFYRMIVSLQENGVLAADTILTGLWKKVIDPYTGAVRSYILWITPFGILLLISGMVRIKPFLRIVLLVFLSLGLILSATRSFLFGTLVGLVTWAFLTKNKRLFVAFTVIALIFYLIPNIGLFPKHVSRIMYFSTDIDRLTSFRYELFTTYWEMFSQNILFGVGIGATEIGRRVSGTPEFFFAQNLRFGGHGFFLGTLYTQGIVGLLPFIFIYIGCIKVATILFNQDRFQDYKIVGLFALMFIAYSIIPFIVGGTETYNQLFIVIALLAGAYANFLKKTSLHE